MRVVRGVVATHEFQPLGGVLATSAVLSIWAAAVAATVVVSTRSAALISIAARERVSRPRAYRGARAHQSRAAVHIRTHTPAQPPFLPAGLHLFHEAGRGDIVAPARQRYEGEVRTSRNGHGEAGRYAPQNGAEGTSLNPPAPHEAAQPKTSRWGFERQHHVGYTPVNACNPNCLGVCGCQNEGCRDKVKCVAACPRCPHALAALRLEPEPEA